MEIDPGTFAKLTSCLLLLCLSFSVGVAAEKPAATGMEAGIAAKFPNDVDIAKHPSVLLVEDFEQGDLGRLKPNWTSVSGEKDGALALDKEVQPPGLPGGTALRVTATKGRNEGGYLYKLLPQGHDELFARMYVRFDEKYGFNHHFCKLGGDKNAKAWPVGRAGIKPDVYFSTGIEPATTLAHAYPGKVYPPPGFWNFYTYWPEMRSWQTESGASNGQPNAYYGNVFAPADPQPILRGVWICVEWSVKLNSAADKSDGSQRFWIDGKLVGEWSPGTPLGYWMRDKFRIRPDEPGRQKPFEGFRWRTDMGVKLNVFKIENYVSERSFEHSAEYARQHPEFAIDTEKATVWFDHIVLATSYIGPMNSEKKP